MEITINFNLTEDDEIELARIIGVEHQDLLNALSPFAIAAVEELITMFLGQKVFSRGSDMLEYRLFLLIIHAFGGKIPDEQEVSRLFQTTTTGSRSLIRAVMSKYQYQLKSYIERTLIGLLNSADVSEDDDSFLVSVHNLNLVEELNRELAEIDTNLPPVQKKRGSVSTYIIFPSSYNRLCKRFAINPKQLDDNE